VCPTPPLIVPELAAGAAGELAGLREACDRALAALAAARPDVLVVVGAAGPGTGMREVPAGTRGNFRPFGVDVPVRLGAGGAPEDAGPLPLSLAVGAWLLGRARWEGPVTGIAVGEGLDPAACAALGGQLADRAARVALLVMGDGSARRTEKAPGHLDPRAEGWDATAARALADADTAAVAALDAGLAADLLAAGRAPWQVLAGAAGEGPRTGRLLYDEAPYGVGYLVAVWD
jgi:hypothetical protein